MVVARVDAQRAAASDAAPSVCIERTRRRRPRLPGGWSLLIYLVASLLLFSRSMVADPLHRLPQGAQADPAQMAWFLTQTPHALLHAHNPFLTNLIDYPYGVNLMWNTLMPLAGVLAYPVTATLGPVAAWNLLIFLGPPTTAWTARLWIGRHVRHRPAAWLGGLLVGFSPFIAGHSLGHLNFVLLPLVPVMLMLIEDLLWRRPRPQPRTGALLGLATAAQMLLSEEVVVIVAVGVIVGILAALLLRRRDTLRAVASAAGGFGVAFAVFLLLCSYPLAVQLFGPHRVAGLNMRNWVAEPVDWIYPTRRIALHLGLLRPPPGQNQAEETSYLGWPVLAVVCVAAVTLRRRVAARVAIATVVAGALLTLVSPFALPVLGEVVPLRYSLITDVALAFLLATFVDTLIERRRRGQHRTRQVGLLVAASAAVATILPAAVPAGRPARLPSFFTSDAVTALPEGAPVLVLPYPTPGQAAPMLWQAAAAMRFRMPGGYALHPSAGGHPTSGPDPDAINLAFRAAGRGRPVTGQQLAAARTLMHRDHIFCAVLDTKAPHVDSLAGAVNATLGHGPTRAVDGVLLWLPGPAP